MNSQMNGVALPNEDGFFGEYGGQFIPPHLKATMDDIKVAYEEIRQTPEFQQELAAIRTLCGSSKSAISCQAFI